jgi:hypothetical protein
VGAKERGYEGAKKVKGRKRHILVDTQGLVIEARLHSAKVVDRDGIKLLLEPSLCPIACPACATSVAGCLSTPAKRGAPDGSKAYWDGVPR